MLEITLTIKNNNIKIYLNGLIHLIIKRDELIGIQSWIEGDECKKYFIEYYTKNKRILTEYDCIDKWKCILELIDKNDFIPTQWK